MPNYTHQPSTEMFSKLMTLAHETGATITVTTMFLEVIQVRVIDTDRLVPNAFVCQVVQPTRENSVWTPGDRRTFWTNEITAIRFHHLDSLAFAPQA